MSSIVSLIFTVLLYCVTARYVDRSTNVEVFGVNVEMPVECMEQWRKFNETLNPTEEKNFYCSVKPRNYPEKHVDSYFERLKQKLQFSDIKEPLHDFTESDDCSSGQEEKNCCTVSAYEEPYWVQSKDQLKLTVHTVDFKQRIRVAKCKNEEAKCFKDFDASDYELQTHCRTDYGSMQVMVYDAKTDTLESVPVSFPIHCSCHIEE